MRSREVQFIILLLLASVSLSGCMVVQVGVTNPIPGLTRVAIVPFFNQSEEQSVDGRRFAAAYYTELQKTPGFVVIPNAVTERAIIANDLQMSGPEDALKLAQLLNVDAVVLGSITEYTPYPPPRLGLQVSWYSPYSWEFFPGIQTDVFERRRSQNGDPEYDGSHPEHPGEEQGWERVKRASRKVKRGRKRVVDTIRGQSEEETVLEDAAADDVPDERTDEESAATDETKDELEKAENEDEKTNAGVWKDRLLWAPRRGMHTVQSGMETVKWRYKDMIAWATTSDEQDATPYRPPPEPFQSRMPVDAPGGDVANLTESDFRQSRSGLRNGRPAPTRTDLDVGLPAYPTLDVPPEHDPLKPFMSYTRIFDGVDSDLQATLRDYLEVRGDMRSGGWEGYLNRSEDFIRFTAHLMVVEMLTLHGGEGKRRIIFKHRKYK